MKRDEQYEREHTHHRFNKVSTEEKKRPSRLSSDTCFRLGTVMDNVAKDSAYVKIVRSAMSEVGLGIRLSTLRQYHATSQAPATEIGKITALLDALKIQMPVFDAKTEAGVKPKHNGRTEPSDAHVSHAHSRGLAGSHNEAAQGERRSHRKDREKRTIIEPAVHSLGGIVLGRH